MDRVPWLTGPRSTTRTSMNIQYATHLAEQGAHDQCREVLASLEHAEWDNPGALIRIALVYREIGELEREVVCSRRVIALGVTSIAIWSGLGTSLCELGRYEEGLPILTRCAHEDPQCYRLVLLGNALHRSGRLDEAAAVIGRAIETDPTDGDAHCVMAEILEDGDPAAATEHCRLSLLHDPEQEGAIFLLAKLRRKSGDLDEARELLERGVALDDRSYWMVISLASLCWLQGDLDRSHEMYRLAVRLSPDDDTKRWLADFCAATGRE